MLLLNVIRENSLNVIHEGANLLWPETLECSGWPWS